MPYLWLRYTVSILQWPLQVLWEGVVTAGDDTVILYDHRTNLQSLSHTALCKRFGTLHVCQHVLSFHWTMPAPPGSSHGRMQYAGVLDQPSYATVADGTGDSSQRLSFARYGRSR